MKYWRETVIIVLLVVLAFIIGKGVERKTVDSLFDSNQKLVFLKMNTETFIAQNGDATLRQIFRRLGYQIAEPDSASETR